jgi:hypothetical protein
VRLASRGIPAHVGWVGDELTVVVCVGDRPLTPLLSILEPLASGRSAGVVVADLATVSVGVRLVREAVATLVDPGILLVNHNWPKAMVLASRELGAVLACEAVAPLLELPPTERVPVLRNLATYLDSAGSIADASAPDCVALAPARIRGCRHAAGTGVVGH